MRTAMPLLTGYYVRRTVGRMSTRWARPRPSKQWTTPSRRGRWAPTSRGLKSVLLRPKVVTDAKWTAVVPHLRNPDDYNYGGAVLQGMCRSNEGLLTGVQAATVTM